MPNNASPPYFCNGPSLIISQLIPESWTSISDAAVLLETLMSASLYLNCLNISASEVRPSVPRGITVLEVPSIAPKAFFLNS